MCARCTCMAQGEREPLSHACSAPDRSQSRKGCSPDRLSLPRRNVGRTPWKRASEKRHVRGKVRRRRNSRPVHGVGSPPRRARSRSVAPCELLQFSLTLRTEPLSCAARTLPVCNCVGPRPVELGASPSSTLLRCCVPQRTPSAEVEEAVEGLAQPSQSESKRSSGTPKLPDPTRSFSVGDGLEAAQLGRSGAGSTCS